MKLILVRRFSVLSFFILFSLGVAAPTSAHHSSNPHFDKELNVNLVGEFTELKLVNPHAYIYMDVEQNGETVNWRCELSSATQLRRWGWSKDTFAVGEQITVEGNPARREDNVCFMLNIIKPDGQTIVRNGPLESAPTNQAATPALDVERPLVLANGQPNLQGPWITLSFGRNAQVGIRANFVSTEAGKLAAQGYDMAFDDPIVQCHFVNILKAWNHDENVNDIIQNDDTIILQYGFMDARRTIHLGMDEHPENIVASSTGHSIGKWEGDTLVVHTIGFEEGILEHRTGQKYSDQMEVVERFHYNSDEKRLYRDYTVVDPLYFVGETKGQDAMALSQDPYSPYGCVELSGKNNIRPTDVRYNQVDASGVSALGSTAQAPVKTTPLVEPTVETPVTQEPEQEKAWYQFW